MIKIKALGRKVVDPTGAGDSYRAGFLVSYLKGNDLETCGKFATTVASFVIESEGSQTNLPTFEDVKYRYEKHWGKLKFWSDIMTQMDEAKKGKVTEEMKK